MSLKPTLLAVSALLALASRLPAQDAPLLKGPLYWIHVMTNLANDEASAEIYRIMERAAKAGYTGVMIHDGRFVMQSFQNPDYIAKVHAFRDRAKALHLSVAAEITPMGYGDEMAHNDLSMIAGMPDSQVPFRVENGRLVPYEPEVHLLNGNLEEWKGDVPAHWEVDEPGKVAFRDAAIKAEGAASLRMQDPGSVGRARMIQRLAVKPHRNYHVSAMVKTERSASRDLRIMALAGFPLNWTPLPIGETMDWKRIDITFDSIDASEIGLYIGTWGGRGGTMWWDDIRIEPAGFVNIVRRDTLPVTVTSEDGKTAYSEGRDFSKVTDPLLAPVISAWHQPPVVTIPPGSRLREGQVVLASFEHAVTNLTDNNTAMCMSDPKVYDDVRRQVQFVRDHLDPDVYFLGHDEIRFCGYDQDDARRGLTCGQILADNIAKCARIVEQAAPGKSMVVWNDMFDPYHNARQKEDDGSPTHFFLAKGDGPFWESWKGMPRQLGVVNWNNDNVKSVQFFAGEGHQQILSHDDPARLVKWLEATKGCSGVVGVMYTTWEGDWSRLESYIAAAKEWRAAHL